MKLLIVESPSKAKTINQYLGKDFLVISSYGHLRGLPSEEGSVLPDEDFKMKFQVLDKSKKQADEIVKQYKKADEVFLATDPDREGEAISWHIVELLKDKKVLDKNIPMKRVVFYEITKKAITAAISKARNVDENLVHAQQARQALDYLVGFNLSPVLWRKLPGSRSAGRVQSVALRLICDRETEIEKFRSDEYWSIHGMFKPEVKNAFKAILTHYNGTKLEKLSIQNEASASSIKAALESGAYHIDDIEKKQIRRNPAPPFTTSTMLQEAARKLGYSAKRTSRIAQDLYEGLTIDGSNIGLITYMRTDSVSLSEDAISAFRSHITDEFGNKYLPSAPRLYKTKSKNAQEAHEAIRPTNISISPKSLYGKIDSDHLKLYELIWKRALASQMENAILDSVGINIATSDKKSIFRATGTTINFDGFLKLYQEGADDEEDEDKQPIPELKVGEKIDMNEIETNQHFTQPPPRYTEASLVKKMEELGIGRPSTYPSIISILQDREYVLLDKKRFMAESKGRLVNAFLTAFFTKYVEFDFTAKLEDQLDDIANGETNWKTVLKGFWTPFKTEIDRVLTIKNVDIVKDIEKHLMTFMFGNAENVEEKTKCPTCSTGTLALKTGKFGAFVGCSNYPECKHIQQLGSGSAFAEEKSEEEIKQENELQLPKILGEHEGKEVSLRKGPYGFYVQLGDGKEVKRTGLQKGQNLGSVDLAFAVSLLSLPRVVGDHPEGGVVKAGIGRFGPYVEYNRKFKSIKNEDPVSITLERALEFLAMESKGPVRAAKAKAPAKKATKTTAKKNTKKKS